MNKFLALSALSILISAPSFAADDYAPVKALYSASQALAQGDLSCAADSDCVTIALGKRACGGPNGFVLTSKNNANLKELKDLAKASVVRESAYNAEHQVFSICSVEMPPQPTCQANVCEQR